MAEKEWNDPFNPFNSIKVMNFAKRMRGIINEDYLPPVVVNLDISGRCQYHCPHCHHRRKQIKSRSLPDLPERLARTFPHMLQAWERDGERPLATCIVGSQGDALLYPGLDRLLRRTHFAGVDIGLVTNGYGWTDKLIDYAVQHCKFIGQSMDAGTEETYNRVHCPPDDGWDKAVGNLAKIAARIRRLGLRNDTCWKMLVLPDSFETIYAACRIARDIGVRYVQIRPADLPEAARNRIDIDVVNDQISRAMDVLGEPGVFEVVGIRHKFTNDFKKVLPKYCYLTPLTVTITSDGKAWPCVDRRWDEPTLLADCGKGGWQALRDVWGSAKHVSIVHDIINRGGEGPACDIRCSNYGYNAIFENVMLQDKMDRRMI